MGFKRETSAAGQVEQTFGYRPAHSSPIAADWIREETRPEVIARLEALDDVIFAAIDGDPAALQQSGDVWQRPSRSWDTRRSKKLAANICVTLKACGNRSAISKCSRRTKSSPRSRSSACW